jgi:tetratricopeptide (TPR) repeat protein
MAFKRAGLPVLLLLLLAVACAPRETQSETERLQADSLSERLNSPELKALNAKILDAPGSAELYNQRAILYRSLKALDAAENDSKRAIRLDSTNAQYYLTLADTYFAGNKTRLAKETLEMVEKRFPAENEALLKLAELYFAVRQYQQAINYTNKALRNDVNNARAYFIKGSVYRESGDTSKAISSLETAIEQDNKMRDAFYDLGIIYATRRNPLAMEYYRQAEAIDNGSTQTRYAMARFLQDQGKTQDAEALYAGIVKTDSSCADCYFSLGAIALDMKKDYRAAAGAFGRAVKADPDFAEAWYWLGYSHLQAMQKDSARAAFIRCIKLNPEHTAAQKALDKL